MQNSKIRNSKSPLTLRVCTKCGIFGHCNDARSCDNMEYSKNALMMGDNWKEVMVEQDKRDLDDELYFLYLCKVFASLSAKGFKMAGIIVIFPLGFLYKYLVDQALYFVSDAEDVIDNAEYSSSNYEKMEENEELRNKYWKPGPPKLESDKNDHFR